MLELALEIFIEQKIGWGKMIIANLFKGPVVPSSYKAIIWKVSSTYTEIHEKTRKNYVWVHIPKKESWAGFRLDGTSVDSEDIIENNLENATIGEAIITELHGTQLQSALLKSLIAQTIGLGNYDYDIHPAANLNHFQGVKIDVRFMILREEEKNHLYMRIDTKDESRKLDTDEGLLNTEERFNQIRTVVNHYWSE